MIFYFSGTGNSAWTARQIAGVTGEELCDSGSLIREGSAWEDETETAVFVTPTYAWRIPHLVEDWIRRSAFGKAAAWFVMTCGDSVGSAGRFNRALSDEKGMRYMGTGKLVMPENYTAMFATPDQEEAKEIIRKARPSATRMHAFPAENAFRAARCAISGLKTENRSGAETARTAWPASITVRWTQ